ncbi:hypothetical protein PtrM4_041410, partial [Pyrenophora tritici-repentis]
VFRKISSLRFNITVHVSVVIIPRSQESHILAVGVDCRLQDVRASPQSGACYI